MCNDIEFDFSKIKDKCILANRQELEINEKVNKIAIAGSSLQYALIDKIKIIYEEGYYEYKTIKFSDYTWDINRSINWMFGKQKNDYRNNAIVLHEDYNYEMEVLNYIYQYEIELKVDRVIKQIVLPQNELLLIFALTIF